MNNVQVEKRMLVKPWKMVATVVAILFSALVHLAFGIDMIEEQAQASTPDVGVVVFATLLSLIGLAFAGWFVVIVLDLIRFIEDE